MKVISILLALLPVLFIVSCSAPVEAVLTLTPQSFQLDKDQLIKVNVDTGEVLITGTPGDSVEVLGTLTTDAALVYNINQDSAGLNITIRYPKRIYPPLAPNPVRLELRIPAGLKLKFESEEANLTVQNFSGNLDVSSTAGNIFIDGLRGSASVKANRGNISMQASQGDLFAFGNYGHLVLKDDHGQVSASTIMGTVQYTGGKGSSDALHFESDHGPVEVNLAGEPDMQVKINSASGEVTCMFTDLERNMRSCNGLLGRGGSQLYVRTVSGNITLQPMP